MQQKLLTPFVALVGVLVTASGALAQTEQAIRDELFGATDGIKARAEAANAALLAPEAYGEAMDLYLSAGEELERGRNLDRVREELTEATAYFERAIEASELAEVTFASTLAAREAAVAAEASTYAEREWSRAERDFLEATRTLEGGNLNRAEDRGDDAEERYRDAESEAIQEKAEQEAGR